MAYDIAGMADFAKSNGKILLTDLVLEGDSFGILPVQDGIKSSDKLVDFADGSTVIQTGDYTGTSNYSGGVSLTDKEIAVKELFVKEKYTSRELQAKISQMAMRIGSNPEDLPYQDALLGLKGSVIALENEKLLWQGDTTKTGTNLAHFNGFTTVLKGFAHDDDDLPTYTGEASAELTNSNAISKVEKIVEKSHVDFPAWIDATTRLFMSPKNFITYYRAVNKLSNSVDKMTNAPAVVKEFTVPGTNVIATSTAGMVGVHDLFITRPENFVIGVDLKSEDEQFKFEFLNESLVHRLFVLYKLGCKIARTQEVVMSGVEPTE